MQLIAATDSKCVWPKSDWLTSCNVESLIKAQAYAGFSCFQIEHKASGRDLGSSGESLTSLCAGVQVKKCADSGADMVRITVQGKQEATACYKIREQLFKDG